MSPRPTATAAVLLLLAVAVAGCSGLRNAVGLGKTSPDALRVIKQDPIAIPPNLDLRPPTGGAVAEDPAASPADGRDILVGAGEAATSTNTTAPAAAAATAAAPSPGEAAILDAARADEADPAIRNRLDPPSGEEGGGGIPDLPDSRDGGGTEAAEGTRETKEEEAETRAEEDVDGAATARGGDGPAVGPDPVGDAPAEDPAAAEADGAGGTGASPGAGG